MNAKYLPLTLLLGCSPAAPTKVAAPVPQLSQPNCSSLDLTQKVGFSTAFTIDEKRFCYGISAKENHYYDRITRCDTQGMPLPQQGIISREFAGPRKDAMELLYIQEIDGDNVKYIPFWREPSGEVSTVPTQSVPENIGQVFQKGRKMLDVLKTTPEICQQLTEYKSSQ